METYPVISKFEQSSHRISSRGQDKDEWSTTLRVFKCLGQVEGRWLNKLLAQLGDNKVLDHWHNLHKQQTSNS